MKNFRNLLVWEKSHQITLSIYKATSNFPKEELYGLVSQSADQLLLFPQISPKDVAEIHKLSSRDF